MSPFYVGYEAGYFTDAGFDLQLFKELPGVQSLPLLASGKLDAGFVGLTPGLVNAVQRGARIRIVAGREISSSSCNLRPLRHRRIAVSASSVFGLFCLDKMLERVGMKRSDVVLQKMGQNERLPALQAGGVDAFLSTTADLNPMLRELKIAPGPSLAEILPNFQYSFIVFGPRLLDADVRAGARFLRAYFRGAREFLGGRTPAFMDEFAKSGNLDPKLVRAGCRDSFELNGRIHLEDMQLFLDWCVSQNYIPGPTKAQSVVDTRFLDALQRMP